MTARERAEELRQQAIVTLLDEKAAIDEMLDTLGYNNPQKEAATQKRRGRPPKSTQPSEDFEQPISHSDNLEATEPSLR